MSKGIVYIMTTSIVGLIKIGQTGTKNYKERMRFLSSNGYAQVNGLKEFFAIELDNYTDKENMLKDLFQEKRLGDTELYAMDAEAMKKLLLSFDGRVIYPHDGENKNIQFKHLVERHRRENMFNMYKKGLKNGDTLAFVGNPKIKVKVVGEREVEYQGAVYKLSPLAAQLYDDMGIANPSKTYQGANYFTFRGTRLLKLPNVE